jgi:hypothetical protein
MQSGASRPKRRFPILPRWTLMDLIVRAGSADNWNITNHQTAYKPSLPGLISAGGLLTLLFAGLGMFELVRGNVGGGVFWLVLAAIALVARLGRFSLFASGDQVPSTWEGQLPAELGKTHRGQVGLIAATLLLGALAGTESIKLFVAEQSTGVDYLFASLFAASAPLALLGARMLGAMVLTLRRASRALDGEAVTASCFGGVGDQRFRFRGQVVVATGDRIVSFLAQLRAPAVVIDSIPYSEVVEVKDGFTDLEIVGRRSSIYVKRTLPTHVEKVANAIKSGHEAS